jgi:hypothetical protein
LPVHGPRFAARFGGVGPVETRSSARGRRAENCPCSRRTRLERRRAEADTAVTAAGKFGPALPPEPGKGMLKVTIWMNMPSPYQSDLFRSLTALLRRDRSPGNLCARDVGRPGAARMETGSGGIRFSVPRRTACGAGCPADCMVQAASISHCERRLGRASVRCRTADPRIPGMSVCDLLGA